MREPWRPRTGFFLRAESFFNLATRSSSSRTHAPIVMAYPGATLYQLDHRGITQVDYDDIEHVR